MRLQLTACAAAVTCLAAFSQPAAANNRVASWLSVYADDDQLTVVSPQVSARADVRENVEVDVSYDVDVISAASIDVVSAASPRGYDERRQGGGAGATYAPDARTSLGVSYLISRERDYLSDGVAMRGSREFVDRRLTARIDARLLHDRLGRAGDDRARWHSLTTAAGAGTASWIFDRYTIGDAAYELQVNDGYQASPYRYVTVDWAGAMSPGVSVPEAVPGRRVRHALAARVRRAFADRWFTSAQYRLYFDDWGVVSHTGELEVQRAFSWDRLLVGASARAYRQSAADFYREHYAADAGTLPVYRSADKMHAASWSVLGGVRAELRYEPTRWFDALRAVAKLEVYQQRFRNFAPLSRRRALITSFGAVAEF